MSLLGELKRRNVFRAAAAYVAVAWLVVQVAETTFPAFGLTDRALRNLIMALAAGLVPAMALAWILELTPEGVKLDRDIEPGSALFLRTNRLLDRAIIALLALGFAYFAIDKFVLEPARDQARLEEVRQEARTEALVESYGDKSIAVLPFTNMSADPEQAYFGDGMAEEVLNLLARIPELRVISRSSAFAYRDRAVKLSQIADELNVAHLLEGSVRRADNKIRVTVQLIEARSDAHLWSQTWDRELEDVFAIQDEIAAEVVANLKLRLLGEAPKADRVDPRAYALFLQGRFLIESNDLQELAPALELMRSAIEIAPDYAKAWSGVAWVYWRYYSRQRSAPIPGAPVTSEEALRLYREATEQALAIDPHNASALTLKGWEFLRITPDYAKAAHYFKRALAASPGEAEVLASASALALQLGRQDLGLALLRAAHHRDPSCTWCQWTLLDVYSEFGYIDEADALVRRLDKHGVNIPEGIRSKYWLAKGEHDLARQVLEHLDPALPNVLVLNAHILIDEGRMDEARAVVEILENESGEASAADIAGLYRQLGDHGRAMDWLEREVAVNGCRRIQLNIWALQQEMQALRQDSRWLELTRQCKVSPEEIASIDFAPDVLK